MIMKKERKNEKYTATIVADVIYTQSKLHRALHLSLKLSNRIIGCRIV